MCDAGSTSSTMDEASSQQSALAFLRVNLFAHTDNQQEGIPQPPIVNTKRFVRISRSTITGAHITLCRPYVMIDLWSSDRATLIPQQSPHPTPKPPKMRHLSHN